MLKMVNIKDAECSIFLKWSWERNLSLLDIFIVQNIRLKLYCKYFWFFFLNHPYSELS